MKILFYIILILGILFISILPDSFSATKVIDETGVKITITYPEVAVRGSDFNISFLIENSASYDRTNSTLQLSVQSEIFSINNDEGFFFDRVSVGSSYGKTITINSLSNSTIGQHFINIDYSHVDSAGDVRYSSSTLPITINEEPKVIIKTNVQDSIFSDAEFPFIVEIESQGSDLKDVTIKIIPPDEVTFRGQTSHTFSSIASYTPISLRAELITATESQVGYEHYIPFQIIVNYTDDTDTKRTTSETISVLLRPKTFFEFGVEGGFWIGEFYFTPTISIGALIGIPTALFGIYKLHKKRTKNR